MEISLLELKVGKKAEIVGFAGGWGMQRRLISMGIKPGKILRKISLQPLWGPITVEVGGARVAIGRGMSSRITVKEI